MEVDSDVEQAETLIASQHAWHNCNACPLSGTRTHVVWGQGAADAPLLIVGEAPGATEDATGLPFVGAAGRLLEYFLAWVSADKDQLELLHNWEHGFEQSRRQYSLPNIFFTNIVGCRPPENRNPTPNEIAACRPRLLDIIYTVDPVLIITVGGLATEAITGKKISITAKRGQLFDSVLPGRIIDITYPVFAVLHTSYLLRQNDFNQDGGMSDKTYNDFVTAMHILDEFNFHHRGVPRPVLRPPIKER